MMPIVTQGIIGIKTMAFDKRKVGQRIRQIGHDGRRKDPEQISSTVKSVLESLSEPEFEERRKA